MITYINIHGLRQIRSVVFQVDHQAVLIVHIPTSIAPQIRPNAARSRQLLVGQHFFATGAGFWKIAQPGRRCAALRVFA
jgi:hypothetical protein